MEPLQSAFGALAQAGSCSPSRTPSRTPSRSSSPQRTVFGFEKVSGLQESPVSVLDSQSSASSPCSSTGPSRQASTDSCQLGERGRQGSLGTALLAHRRAEQQRRDMLATGPRLSIATRGPAAGGRGLRLRPARSAQQPPQAEAPAGAAAAPAVEPAASELLPCDATVPASSGFALATKAQMSRQQSSNLDIPTRWAGWVQGWGHGWGQRCGALGRLALGLHGGAWAAAVAA